MKLLKFSKINEKIKSLSKREKIILYVTLAIILTVATDRILFRMVVKSMGSADKKIQSVQNDIDRSFRLLGQKERMLEEVEFYADYAKPEKSGEEGTLELLKEIQAMASASSVNLLYSKPGRSDESDGGNVFKVNFECEGLMEKLIDFFYKIENSKNLLRFEKYTVQPTSKGSSVIKCAATVSMTRIP